ncbi:mechanosensitive ion channel family protein [Pelosinus propionicus]|uniref:Small conductance mechanosensitive channel n=1 Tax=Pelosinus propionicus DSM 13327 TaxID=1123291 RepID=A0A1I4KW85_9FIRM|nr:mechanosensitive ion channel family protein [Pelosinus propionicus]SFL83042.1 small conductance mechanosensitive channel [Pelosinus propionicus DSM 13327]
MPMLLTPEFLLLAGNKIVRLVAILLGSIFILRLFSIMVNKMFIPKVGISAFHFDEGRARTLGGLLQSIIRYIIYFITIIMILQEFQIDTTSLVAGAGIIGLALGVGSQSLIRDFVTGFFIVLENQFAVGDYIVSGDMAGTVEDIGLRVTKLRDGNGVLHIIPHGAISRISNHTRGHMQAVVNVPVAYEANLDEVLLLLEQACISIGKELEEVLEGPKVLGIVDLGAQMLMVRIVAKTVPLQQGKVENALRYEIKRLFNEAKIPHPVVDNFRR